MNVDSFAALLADVAQRALALTAEPPRQAALAALFAELETAYAALQTSAAVAAEPLNREEKSHPLSDGAIQALRWSEARFRTAAYLVSDSIYEVDLASGQTTIYGGEPYADQGLELTTLDVGLWEALLHPDDRERVLTARQELLTHNRPFREEYRLLLPDGSVRFLADRSVILTQPDGRRRQIGVTSDTSDRIVAERRQRFLVEASAVLNTSLDFDDTAACLAQLVVPTLADWSVIYAVDGEALQPIASAHRDPAASDRAWQESLHRPIRRVDAHPIAEVLRTGQPLILAERPVAPLPPVADGPASPPLDRTQPVVSTLIAPLTVGGRQVGILALMRGEPQQRYSVADLAFAQEVAERAAMALENAQLYEAVQRQLAELTALHGVARVITSQLDITQIFQTVVAELGAVFGYQLVSIYLLQHDMLVPQAAIGYATTLSDIPLTGIKAQVVHTAEPIFVRDAASGPPDLVVTPEARQAVIVPLSDRAGVVQGLLRVESTGVPTLTEGDVALLSTLAKQVGLAFANARLFADLQAVNALLQGLLTYAPTPIYAVTTQMRVRLVNPAFEALMQQSYDQLVGRLVTDVFPGTDGQAFVATNQELLTEGRPLLLEEFVETESGRRIFQTAKFPLYGPTGQPEGVAGISIDITAHKQAEAERLQLERRMLETQRLESLGLMAGGIAHDFNNLLTGIMGHAEIALADLPPTAPAYASVATVIRSARHAAELTSQLLAYAGKGRFAIEALDLNLVVQETVDLLVHSLVSSIKVEYQLAAGLPAILADRAQIRQVVLNLITNAVEALGAATGSITLKTHAELLSDTARQAHLRAQGSNAKAELYVYLGVRDSGCGMDAATLARIFDPFFSTKFTGRGLGLAAVQGIVRGHQGLLEVESAPGAGSTFHLWLPAAPALAVAPGAALLPATPATDGPRGTVLVIDDDPAVRAVSQLFLERMGFRSASAADGAAGLEALQQGIAGLAAVLLDLTMPQMTGDSVARQIRRRWPGLPIVLMSGYHSDEIADKYANLGLDGFVQKPFSSAALQAALVAALRLPTPDS